MCIESQGKHWCQHKEWSWTSSFLFLHIRLLTDQLEHSQPQTLGKAHCPNSSLKIPHSWTTASEICIMKSFICFHQMSPILRAIISLIAINIQIYMTSSL
jgi:hypothetical protein